MLTPTSHMVASGERAQLGGRLTMTGSTTEHVSAREVGELAQAVVGLTGVVDRLDGTISELRKDISDNYVRKDVINPQLAGMQKQIDGHSSWMTWVGRIIIGTVMAALLYLVVAHGGLPS